VALRPKPSRSARSEALRVASEATGAGGGRGDAGGGGATNATGAAVPLKSVVAVALEEGVVVEVLA
jgi:hypothetical protein